MSSTNSSSSGSKPPLSNSRSARARYKVTRTVTGPDGQTYTETIEMHDDDAVKLMRDLRANRSDVPDLDRFGFRPLTSPSSFPQVKRRSQSSQPRTPLSSTSSSKSTPTTATGTSKHATVGQETNEFFRESLQVHNDLRKRHGVAPLTINNDLCKLAQQWANHLAATGTLVHSKTKYRNVNVGENLRCQSWPMTGKEMTESWYNECKKYDYRTRSYQPGTGHFTQVIWKGSQEVGFAQAKGTSMNFAVAMYYPPGNYVGEFDKNVFPPK